MAKRIDKRLTDDDVIDVDFFRDDINEMYQSAEKIDELADRIDDDLNNIYFNKENRAMIGRGVLPYVSSSIETLASLRNAKCSAINQTVQVKLKVAQLAMNKRKNDEVGVDTSMIAKEFQKLFMQNSQAIQPKNAQAAIVQRAMSNTAMDDDKALDAKIAALESSGDLAFTDNELAIKYEKRGVVFKVIESSINPRFVACAQDNGEILNDYPVTLLPDHSLLETGMLHPAKGKYICQGGIEYDILS